MRDFLVQVKIWLNDLLGLAPAILENIVWTLVAVGAYLIICRIINALVALRVKDVARSYLIRKTASYLVGFVGLLVLIKIWLGGLGRIAQYIGILSAGVAIALREPLSGIAGWLFLTVRKPFTVGDRVQIGDHAGDVIDIRMLQFSLVEIGNWVEADQSTGRIIHVPNGRVFVDPIANYTQGFNFIWNELEVTVTFESNFKKAKDLLQEIANRYTAVRSEYAAQQVRKAAQKYMIFFQHLTPIVWTDVVDHGVKLSVRYLCEPRRRRSTESEIWEAILEAFGAADDIDFAYPTHRFYDNAREGKSQAKRTK